MAVDIGTIAVNLEANVARLQTDMAKATGLVEKGAGEMAKAADFARTSLASIGIGLSAGLVLSEFKRAVDYLADLDDAAEMAGSSVENISRLLGVAAEAGKGLQDVVGYATQLQRAMLSAEQDTGRAAQAFKALGLNLSEFSDSTDALIEFARAMNQYEDGANKTQLAIAVLGRAGAQALPFLKDLANAQELGARYSSEQAAEAEKLQKQMARLGFEFDQAKVKLLGGLIPAITAAIQEFRMAREAGLGFFEALNTIAVGSKTQQVEMQVALIARLRAELEGLGSVRTFFDPGAEERLSAQLIKEEKRLEILHQQGRAQGLFLTQAELLYGPNGYGERGANLQAPALADDTKLRAAAEATKKLNEAYLEAIGIAKDYAENVGQLETLWKSGRLTQDEYVASVKKLAEAQPVVKAEMEAAAKAVKELDAAEKEAAATRIGVVSAITDETAKIREQIVQQRQQNEEIGLTRSELEQLKLTRLDDAIATREQVLAGLEFVEGSEAEIAAMRQQIEALKLLKEERTQAFELQSEADAAEAAKKAGEAANAEWVKQSESIEKSLTDALMRGFEGGKGFLENLVDSAKNLFNTLVLRPTIQAIVSPLAAGATSLLGLPGTANAAGGAAGGFGGLGSLMGGVSSFGGYLASGAMNTVFGTGLSASLSAAGSMISGGSMLSGLGMGLGAVAPFALPVIAALSLLSGRRGGPKSGGSSVISTFSGLEDGSRLFTPNNDDATLQALTGGYAGSLSRLATGLGGSAASLTAGLGYDTDPQGTASDRISAFLMDALGNALYDVRDKDLGRDADIAGALGEQVSQMLIAGLQASNLPATYAEYFAQFDPATLSSGQAEAAIAAANSARALYDSTVSLGGVFNQVGGLSVEARNGLVAMTGGLEQFLQLVGGYVSSYYTSEEQTGLAAAGVLAQLQAAGFTGQQLAGLDTKSEFRALVDSLDISSDTGQRQLSTLLSVSDEFASIAGFLTENALDLSGAAQLSPGGPAFAELARNADANEAILVQQGQAYTDMVSLLRSIDTRLQSIETAGTLADAAPEPAIQSAG